MFQQCLLPKRTMKGHLFLQNSDQLLSYCFCHMYLFSYYKKVEEDRKIKSLFNKMMDPERKQHFVFFLILASAPLQ